MKAKDEIGLISFSIGELAVQAMLYEVLTYPKPGLVSPINSGSHSDMDYYKFIDSTTALIKFMLLFSKEGYSNKSHEEIFKNIRDIGIEAEKEMFLKTSGINTHKGMLFVMGITVAAVSKTLYENQDFKSIQGNMKAMTIGITKKDFKDINLKKDLSHGEKLYLKYGIKGVRKEVEKGLPLVFNYSLPFYEENKLLVHKDRIVNTLIGIMQYCDDTTILYRHSIDTLNEVKERSKYILDLGGMCKEEGIKEIMSLEEDFIKRKISPGGSADILAVTIFLEEIKKKFFINELEGVKNAYE
ncbi:triphosphoribosyl-dephospho-CoA synthase CitG [Clostridium algidicarnis]|uniref:triphosphoribosyl-dephospho-CoA synthase CitG n=1 Tax=Clostridium algidicarnis TaxID=37659 RepID=UPI000497203F|nr:triphosphoribosyl-dephospho-CoA synthase CitG [Clostridium algidicarnis]